MPFDPSFGVERAGLRRAIDLMSDAAVVHQPCTTLPESLPGIGVGEERVLEMLAPHVLGRAARLDAAHALAHMDPPTPWITWAATLWNARLNQNLLHPATAPFAREAERLVVEWIAPTYGMDGGHMTAGSTLANITALWAARERAGITRVVASSAAHISIRKAASILGLAYVVVPTDAMQRLEVQALPVDLSDACLVLTAGTTSAGAIDSLDACGRARWTHVDAAWAGPMRFSDQYGSALDHIERADSISISAHKWLFQPKESALILFRDSASANAGISVSGAYLAEPNVGVLGSHGANAIPLLATLLAWGRTGVAMRIDRCVEVALALEAKLRAGPFEVFSRPQTGIVVFKPLYTTVAELQHRLPAETVSTTTIEGERWLRCVAANPNADVEAIAALILDAAL